MDPITAELTTAQEAFMGTLKVWEQKGGDITPYLLQIEVQIKESIARGQMAAWVGSITEVHLAEKLSRELEKLGYHAVVQSGGQMPQPDGSLRPVSAVVVNWRWMPPNSRDEYTT